MIVWSKVLLSSVFFRKGVRALPFRRGGPVPSCLERILCQYSRLAAARGTSEQKGIQEQLLT